MQPMKTITLFAALAFGTAMTQQAVACDWGLHADRTNATVVVCDNGNCSSVEPSIAQQAAPSEPTAPTVAEASDNPAPVAVALH
jgi:hypothetical protein